MSSKSCLLERGNGPVGVRSAVVVVAAFCWLALVVVGGPEVHAQSREYILSPDDDRWIVGEAPDPLSPEGQLLEIRRALRDSQYERAENLATAWLDRHPLHPLRPHALLARGDAKLARGDEYKALFDYEAIATLHPGSDVFVIALERELDIARMYANGMRRRLWGMRILRAHDEAQELLIRIQERLPGSQLAEEAGMELGDFYFRTREMRLAAEAYALFIENYPRSPRITRARERLIASHLASYRGPEHDSAGLGEARAQIRTLQRVDPVSAQEFGSDALLLRIDESHALQLLTQARWYLRANDVISAELSIRRTVRRYPRTIAAYEAILLGASILDRLPPIVVAAAPDYVALARLDAPPPPEVDEESDDDESPVEDDVDGDSEDDSGLGDDVRERAGDER